jgi:GT2 family glycosyltransferase
LKITLCIVNHNGTVHLRDSLPSVIGLGSAVDEVLLLDNASTDGGQDFFLKSVPDGRVIQLTENRSPGAARSAGFKAARNDYILFADNDIRLSAAAVQKLASALDRRSNAAIAMPRVILSARPERIQYEGAYCHWLGHMILRNEDSPLHPPEPEPVLVDSMVSACFMVVRTRWPDATFFDPGYLFYYEDHDVGVRARLAGREILAVAEAVVMHGAGTANLSLRPGGSYAPRRVLTLIEGRWRHLIKNVSIRSLVVLAPGLLAYELAQLAGAIAKGWLPHWWRALCNTKQGFKEIRAARSAVQGTRRITDRELLRGGPVPFRPELAGGSGAKLALAMLNAFCGAYWKIVRRLL